MRRLRAVASIVSASLLVAHVAAVYFVMERIAGENLEALLRREGPLGWAEAKPIIVQIATAVAAAHAEGIIHRDIKPANCMVYDDGAGRLAVKVLDFGLAKLTGEGAGALDVTSSGELFGTVAYMAPELTQGKKADERTDIYALGVLAYSMLRGEHPFRGETAFQILTHHVNTAPAPLRDTVPGILPAVEDCVLRAMAKDPSSRFASVEEMRAAIAAIPEGMPLVPMTPVVIGSGAMPELSTESLRIPAQQTAAVSGEPISRRRKGVAIAIGAGVVATILVAWVIHAAREQAVAAETAVAASSASPIATPAKVEAPRCSPSRRATRLRSTRSRPRSCRLGRRNKRIRSQRPHQRQRSPRDAVERRRLGRPRAMRPSPRSSLRPRRASVAAKRAVAA